MEKIIELAKKLHALAIRGVGGEKENAVRLLERLLKEHKLTEADIVGEEINYHPFKVKKEDFRLFCQVARSVILNADIYSSRKSRLLTYLECTAAEAIEIEAKFQFFKHHYEQEVDVFYRAFVQTNNIFHPDAAGRDYDDLSEEERAELKRIARMGTGIKTGHFNKQLEK